MIVRVTVALAAVLLAGMVHAQEKPAAPLSHADAIRQVETLTRENDDLRSKLEAATTRLQIALQVAPRERELIIQLLTPPNQSERLQQERCGAIEAQLRKIDDKPDHDYVFDCASMTFTKPRHD